MATITYNLDQDDLREALTEYMKQRVPGQTVKYVTFHHTEDDRAPGVFYYSASVEFVNQKDC
jgi:flavorubredoxin